MGWFEVDKGGLRQLLEGRDKSFVIRELVQNVFDEGGVTKCEVRVSAVAGRPLAWVTVEDDAPEGFYDITHSYTLFSHTRKRADSNKRGRFNLGEKQVLALCKEAQIETTTGTVIFKGDKRTRGKAYRTQGSKVSVCIHMTREEVEGAIAAAGLFIPPNGIKYTVNGERIVAPVMLREITAALATEYEDEEGRYRTTRRTTTIGVFEEPFGGKAMIYEMGLPIVETGDRWSYDIRQRVPMNMDRDNVSAAFLRDVRAEVLNAMAPQVEVEVISDAWVRDGMSDERIATEAVQRVISTRYGDRVAVGVPGDAKSREEAISRGYRVVTGSEMSEAEWDAVRAAGGIAWRRSTGCTRRTTPGCERRWRRGGS